MPQPLDVRRGDRSANLTLFASNPSATLQLTCQLNKLVELGHSRKFIVEPINVFMMTLNPPLTVPKRWSSGTTTSEKKLH